jgi:hypothetical protein
VARLRPAPREIVPVPGVLDADDGLPGRCLAGGIRWGRTRRGGRHAGQPTVPQDLIRIAADYHVSIPPDRMAAVAALVDGLLAPYDDIDATDEPHTAVRCPRAAAQLPAPEDNPLGAWSVRTRIEGLQQALLRDR